MTIENNPLLQKSDLPYELPDWELIKPEHIIPALEHAIATQRQAWEAVASDTSTPTVENTVEALENAGELIESVLNTSFTLISSVGGEAFEKIEAEMGPMMAEHFNAFYLDERIYHRLRELNLDDADAETRHFVTELLAEFEQRGVALSPEQKSILRQLDTDLSEAEIAFGQRVVQAMSDNELLVTDRSLLAGLSEEKIASYTSDDGTIRLPLENFTNQPLQTELLNHDTRTALLATSMNRGFGEHESSDTRHLVLKIAQLRAQRAELLGYPHHSQAVAQQGMAKDAEAILQLLISVAKPAVEAVKVESDKLKSMAHDAGQEEEFSAADWIFYQEKLRADIGLDDAAMAPYFLLENVVENGIFFAAHELYGISFVERTDLHGYLPSVRTWEVVNDDGVGIALFQADFYRRKGKHGGAWMHEIVAGSSLSGKKPLIMNNCNFEEPPAGEPCLLTWDNVVTVFHEFGHALHGILTNTKYRSTSGTHVPRDFVETPSQLNEMWAYNPQVLARYAVHYRSGEPLPEHLVTALAESKTFGQAFETTELLASALLDQAWHRISSQEIPANVEDFEKAALEEYGVYCELIPPRYRSTYFNHTFGGGYDAGYYSYIWAEVLAADIENWFKTSAAVDGDGGLNRAAGERVRSEILARGNSRAPMDSFRALLGRDPRPEAILERRGLA
ncbi:M3 family metallopeptidase [Arcanobacterium bovis]|uniref:M3 family peptidase n=1 Tax=Arcanobacterium bovis TaxID=2529275 RepID=A0A4Q9V093_9ACTO|nr:M3 family metallopeptidase [Arcanobacterium bovis]TBW22073.1 M3 family peptidase [Arcanobacterium bovis]